MSVELISVLVAVLAIGATLAGLILTTNRGLRQGMARLDGRIGGRGADGAWPSEARRAAGRLARGHHRTGQRQLRMSAA